MKYLSVLKKIYASELFGIFEGNVRIHKIDLQKKTIIDGIEIQKVELILKWQNNSIFVYEENEAMKKKILIYKVGDVVAIRGRLKNPWYPGSKPLVTIDKVLEIKRIGVV